MKHLGIIPDGAGRWAAKRNLPRVNGYYFGIEVMSDFIDAADELGINCLSFYCSSIENIERRGEAYSLSLSSVYVDFFEKKLKKMALSRGYKICFAGDFKKLSPELMSCISNLNALTINNRKMTVAFVFAYDGMEEVKEAFNYVFQQKLLNADYTEATIEEVQRYMYSAALPPLDAVIRYGGVNRLSGYLPFSAAYAELFFFDKLFPDADKGDVYEVVKEFRLTKRNFGGYRE